MNVFIDANIFLSFFHLSNEDLEELKKTLVLHHYQKIVIWLPLQVRDEFRRNRAGKIADALKRFEADKLSSQIPQMLKSYPEFSTLNEARRSFEEAKNRLKERLLGDVKRRGLKADQVVDSIFAKASKVELSQAILLRAQVRADRGNPPGKLGSYGDAINWECLIEAIPQGEDLHIISEDADYFSSLVKDSPNEYLTEEWLASKGSNLFLYKRLSSFLSEHFPKAHLASELEKECAITKLAVSASFAQTHNLVARLDRHAEFTKAQVDGILDAVLSNNQVNWILDDEDVCNFIKRVVDDFGTVAEPDKVLLVKALLTTQVVAGNE
jgi:hypothetical protein